METGSRFWKRIGLTVTSGMILPAALGWMAPGWAGETEAPANSVLPAAAEEKTLDLAACKGLALEKQPSLAAYRASLDAANGKASALENLGLAASLISHDLPIRRQQAALGIEIAKARVTQTEYETLYAVTRNYLTYLYAHQQQELLDKALDNLKDLKDTVKQIVDDGLRKDVTTRDLDRINVLVLLAEGRREEAINGAERAQGALREAMGYGSEFSFKVAGKGLPFPKAEYQKKEILDLALARRAELVQANDAVEVFCLEIKAQGTSRHIRVNTFTSASDLHATPIPQGSQNGEYRPGAVGPEMPPTLVGNRSEREDQAGAYYRRAQAVAEKTKNLVMLEAEDGFLRWKEANRKATRLLDAAEKGEKLGRDLRDDFKQPGSKVRLDEVTTAGILATQLRVQANEALHELAMALSYLERVTAGGITVDYSAVPKPK